MKWLSALVLLGVACLSGCATQPASMPALGDISGRYESRVDQNGGRLILRCDRAEIASPLCQLWAEDQNIAGKSKMALEFLPLSYGQQYLKNLISTSATDAVANPERVRKVAVAKSDLAPLQVLATDQSACFADKKYADLLLVCQVPRQGNDAVVVFMRGLCDRCQFEPTVLRKKS